MSLNSHWFQNGQPSKLCPLLIIYLRFSIRRVSRAAGKVSLGGGLLYWTHLGGVVFVIPDLSPRLGREVGATLSTARLCCLVVFSAFGPSFLCVFGVQVSDAWTGCLGGGGGKSFTGFKTVYFIVGWKSLTCLHISSSRVLYPPLGLFAAYLPWPNHMLRVDSLAAL